MPARDRKEYQRLYRLYHKKYFREYADKYRKKAVARGLCGFCFKPRDRKGFLCESCRIKHRDKQRAKKSQATLPESSCQPPAG